jgi:hypothetical protein
MRAGDDRGGTYSNSCAYSEVAATAAGFSWCCKRKGSNGKCSRNGNSLECVRGEHWEAPSCNGTGKSPSGSAGPNLYGS